MLKDTVQKLNITDLLVMGALQKKSLYGYELKQLADEWHIELWAGISLSSIYHSLKKLEKLNLVNREVKQKGHMELRIYSLTELGIEAFFELEFEMLASFDTMGPMFGVPLLFINQLPIEKQLEGLQRRSVEIQKRMASYEKCQGGKERVDHEIRGKDYPRLGNYLIWFYDNHIEWLDRQINNLQNNVQNNL